MSHNYTFRGSPDDFCSQQDMYTDSYQRESDMYHPSLRSPSPTHSAASSSRPLDSDVLLPGKALSFLHSCGLDSSDLAHLAELPEHLITVDTLPDLLLQIKERKLSSASSPRSSTTRLLGDAWEGSSHTDCVEYPIDQPAHPLYPLPPEQVQSWQDRWGNNRRTGSMATVSSGSRGKRSSSVDYGLSRDTDRYCETQACSSSAPRSSSAVSCSYVDHDSGPKPLLSLIIDPPAKLPSRREALDFNGRLPSCFPYTCTLCEITIHSVKDWTVHIGSAFHKTSQLELLQKFPNWNQSTECVRRGESQQSLGHSSPENVHTVPTRKEALDFHGRDPPFYPYSCVLCDITVLSEKDWTVHIKGAQHASSQFDFLEKYPLWDQTVESARRNEHTSVPLLSPTGDGTRKTSKSKDESYHIVCFNPLPDGDGITSELVSIAKRFGSVRNHLFLQSQGYVEMSHSADAKKLVSHYSTNPLKLNGTVIQLSCSYKYDTLKDLKGANRLKSHTRQRSNPGRDSSQKGSPSPKRRRSSDKTHSSNSHSKDQSESSSKKTSHSSHSSDKDAATRKSSRSSHSSKNGSTKKSSQSSHSTKKSSSSTSGGRGATTKKSPQPSHSSAKTGSTNKSSTSRSSVKDKTTKPSSSSHSTKDVTTEKSSRSPAKDGTTKKSSQSTDENDSTKTSCPLSPSKEESTKSSVDAEVMNSISSDCVYNSDSDLEGMEVIADDEESLHSTDDQEMDMLDIPDVQKSSDVPVADTSVSLQLEQGPEDPDNKEKEEEPDEGRSDLPGDLEKCVTLDELVEDGSEESKEPVDSISTVTGTSDEIAETTVDPVAAVCTDTEQSAQPSEVPQEEITSSVTAETKSTEDLENNVEQSREEEDSTSMANDIKETFGKVLTVRNLPRDQDYTDTDFMNIINRYGKVAHFVLFRNRKRAFVEMVEGSDAERLTVDSKNQDVALRGSVLKIEVSEKYSCLPAEGFNIESDSDEEESCKNKNDDLNGNTGPVNTTDGTDETSEQTNKPIGTEFVGPVVGYFCNLCKVIYASEAEAKDEHCRTQSHHEKVKEHKAKSGST